MEVQVEKERHPIRFMLKLLLFVGVVYAAGRFLAMQKEQWMGLTESQARAKVESKLSSRVGEDKASEIADQVVTALTEKGIIKPDPKAEAAAEEPTSEDDE